MGRRAVRGPCWRGPIAWYSFRRARRGRQQMKVNGNLNDHPLPETADTGGEQRPAREAGVGLHLGHMFVAQIERIGEEYRVRVPRGRGVLIGSNHRAATP